MPAMLPRMMMAVTWAAVQVVEAAAACLLAPWVGMMAEAAMVAAVAMAVAAVPPWVAAPMQAVAT